MKKLSLKNPAFKNPRILAIIALVVIVGGLAVWRIFAAGGRIFAVPSTTSVNPGDTFTVDIQADSGGTTVNAATVSMSYPQDKLDVVGIDFSTAGIPHSTAVPTNSSSSPITFSSAINNGNTSGANIELAKVTFQVKSGAVGSINLSFNGGAQGTQLIEDQNFTDVVNGNFGNVTVNINQPLQAPGAPGNLHSTNVTPTAISLAWDAPTTGGAPDSYVVTRTNDNAALPATNGTSITDSGLQPNTVYHYKVHAVNAAGTGPDSTVVDVATAPAPVQPPGAVVGLAVSAHTINSITVNWQAPTNGGAVSDYMASIQPEGGAFSNPVQLSANTLGFTFTNLEPATNYTVKVRAENSAGGSDATVAAATDENPTQNLTAKLYLNPPTATAANGTTISFDVRVDTGGSDANAVAANITYPTDQFDNVTVDESNSDFSVAPAPATVNNGVISIARASALGTTVNGDKLLARINLHVTGTSGTASLNFDNNNSQVFNGDVPLLFSTTGANVTLFQNQTPPPNPPGGNPGGNPGGVSQPPQPTTFFTPGGTNGQTSPGGTEESGSTPAPTDNTVTVSNLPSGQSAQVTILVQDGSGHPVAGAKVEINGLTATTDANGKAIFNGMQAGSYTVNVTNNGKTTSSKISVASPSSNPTQSFKVVFGTTSGINKLPVALLALLIIIVLCVLGFVLYKMGFFARMKPRGELAGGGKRGAGVHEQAGTTFVPHKSNGSGGSGAQVFYPKDDHKS